MGPSNWANLTTQGCPTSSEGEYFSFPPPALWRPALLGPQVRGDGKRDAPRDAEAAKTNHFLKLSLELELNQCNALWLKVY